MKIINKIKEYRKGKGLSQVKLADSIGISHQQISYLESGRFQLAHKLDVDKLSEALDQPVEEIFTIIT